MSADVPVVAILNNQIMPYRVPLFTELVKRGTLRPYVLYSSRQEWDRSWTLDHYSLDYPHKILPGFAAHLPKPMYGEWRTIWINPTLFGELWHLKPDVIIAYEYSIPAITALIYSQIAGCKYITWTEMTAHTERMLSRGQRWTRHLIRPKSQAFIVTSIAAGENLTIQGISDSSIFVAPQPFDVRRFQQKTQHWRSQTTSQQPVLLYAGQLNERKGVAHLLHAFAMVLAQIPAALLKIAGTGKLRNALIKLASELKIEGAVEFVDFIEPEEMPQFYAGGCVFVVPSLEDTFALVAAEAMAGGLSIICSKYAGFARHLNDGQQAFVVDPENHQLLAERIIQLLCDETLRIQFQQSSQLLLEQFTPAYSAGQFESAVRYATNIS